MTEQDEKSFTVDFASGMQLDLDALRRRRSPVMPDNHHAWVINTVYALDDPEQAMDSMELGPDNFIGVTAIHCLLCMERYQGSNRYHKCPQTLATATGADSTEACA